MANEFVKFYRLGSNDTSVSYEQYQTYVNGDASNGGIVFARVWNPDKEKTDQYIWANGIEYLVNSGDVDSIDASVILAIIDSSNKVEPVDSSAAENIAKSAEGIKVNLEYREGADASSLLFGVDLDKIYLPHGVKRTEAIGSHPETDEVVTEGEGWSVKQLLEYYLLKEKYPDVSILNAIATTPAFDIVINKPKDLVEYMDSNITLAEVGTEYTFNGIELDEHASHTGEENYSSTESIISNMNFGSTPSLDIPVDGNRKTVSAGPIVTSASYSDYSLSYVEIQITNNRGFTGIETKTCYTDIANAYVSLNPATGVIVEGENSLSLSWETNISIERTLSQTSDNEKIPAMNYYYASNIGNVSANMKATTDEISWTDERNIAPTPTYDTTTFVVYGVYPIYSNGIQQTYAESEGSFTTNTIEIVEDEENKTVNAKKLALYNYTMSANHTCYVGFGTCNTQTPKIFYVPASANILSITGGSFNTNDKSVPNSFDGGCGTWHIDGNVTINGVTYVRWINNEQFGPQNIKIVFA